MLARRLPATPPLPLLAPPPPLPHGPRLPRVGVSYEAFQTQGQRCAVPTGTCLARQLSHYYTADEAAGGSGTSFLWHSAIGPTVLASAASAATAALRLGTSVNQATVVTLMLNADALRYVQRVAAGVITAASAPSFAAMSDTGVLTVGIRSTGSVRALFTVTVACPAAAPLAPLVAQQLTLDAPPAAGSAGSAAFALTSESLAGGVFACTVTLLDGLGRQVDSRAALINATAAALSDGAQDGDLAPGAPGATINPGTGAGAGAGCAGCGGLDLVCLVVHLCVGALGGWAGALGGVLAAAVGYGLLCYMWPALAFAPCKAIGGLICGRGGSGGGGGGGGCAGGRGATARPRPAGAQARRSGARADDDSDRDEGVEATHEQPAKLMQLLDVALRLGSARAHASEADARDAAIELNPLFAHVHREVGKAVSSVESPAS